MAASASTLLPGYADASGTSLYASSFASKTGFFLCRKVACTTSPVIGKGFLDNGKEFYHTLSKEMQFDSRPP